MSAAGRVIFDTSTLVSAALRVGSMPHRALMQAFASCTLCVSVASLAELDVVLNREKFERYLGLASRQAFAALIRRNSQLCDVSDADAAAAMPQCRDPKDDMFLALAVAAEADCLVSSDEDLLSLNPWRRVPIFTPVQFLER